MKCLLVVTLAIMFSSYAVVVNAQRAVWNVSYANSETASAPIPAANPSNGEIFVYTVSHLVLLSPDGGTLWEYALNDMTEQYRAPLCFDGGIVVITFSNSYVALNRSSGLSLYNVTGVGEVIQLSATLLGILNVTNSLISVRDPETNLAKYSIREYTALELVPPLGSSSHAPTALVSTDHSFAVIVTTTGELRFRHSESIPLMTYNWILACEGVIVLQYSASAPKPWTLITAGYSAANGQLLWSANVSYGVEEVNARVCTNGAMFVATRSPGILGPAYLKVVNLMNGSMVLSMLYGHEHDGIGLGVYHPSLNNRQLYVVVYSLASRTVYNATDVALTGNLTTLWSIAFDIDAVTFDPASNGLLLMHYRDEVNANAGIIFIYNHNLFTGELKWTMIYNFTNYCWNCQLMPSAVAAVSDGLFALNIVEYPTPFDGATLAFRV